MFRYDMISSLHFKFIMKLLGQSDSCGAQGGCESAKLDASLCAPLS